MRDYAETVNRLRNWPRICAEYKNSVDELHDDAADAIEELLAENNHLREQQKMVQRCKGCATQHIDPDGLRWCEENSMVVADDFYCGYWEKPAPPKEVE